MKVSQPAVSQKIRQARSVPAPRPGFSGATPREIALHYAAGNIDREQAIDELSRFEYTVEVHAGPYDDLGVSDPMSPEGLRRALHEELIDLEMYGEIVENIAAARRAAH